MTKRVRLAAEDRRREIVDAAFALLASHGFEGLRTRDVAERVQINSATLHHHFATKEDLIAAIAARLKERLRSEKAPRRATKGVPPALAALRAHFADMSFYRRHRPDILVVYRELALRAERDAPMRAVVDDLTTSWQTSIEEVLAEGKEAHVFRSDLHPPATATLIVSILWGAFSLEVPDPRLERSLTELERWLIAPRG